MSQNIPVYNALAIIFLVSSCCFFPKQLHINLSTPRLIGLDDIVTKKLNFDIQSVIYASVLDDCCIHVLPGVGSMGKAWDSWGDHGFPMLPMLPLLFHAIQKHGKA